MSDPDVTADIDPARVERASQQARNGWGPIPLPTGKKAMPPKGFTGNDSPDPSYADWFTVYSEAPDRWGNLGARIPANVVGVDVDAYDGKNGAATWRLIAGPDLPETVVLSSRFGPGYDASSGIRFYRLPEGFDQSTLWGAHDGIEILRFGHRYAVSPGSIHPNGSTYMLLDMRAKTFLDVLPPVADLPQLTPEQAALLTVDGAPWAGEASEPRPIDTNEQCAYVARQLNKAIGRLKNEDSRYGAMSTAVWALVKAEDEGHHLGEALEILKLAYVGVAAKDRREAGAEPPASEFDRNVKDAYRKVAADPTDEMFKQCCSTGVLDDEPLEVPDTSSDASDDGEVVELTPYEKAVQRRYAELRVYDDAQELRAAHLVGEAKPLVRYSLREFLDQPDDPEPYLIQDLWPKGGRVMLAAGAKTGKTTLVVSNLIPSLVDGTPFLGKYEAGPVEGRVMYLNLEVGPSTLRGWMRRAGITNIDAVEVVNLRGIASALTIGSARGRARVSQLIRDAGATCVIADPIAPLLASLNLDENSNADIARFFNYWTETMKEAGVTDDMIVHHTGHSGDRSRGASRLLDEPDAIWTLTKDQGDMDETDDGGVWEAPPTRFLQAIGRDVMLPAEELSFDHETGLLSLTGVAKSRSITKSRAEVRKAHSITQIRELMSDGKARSKSAIGEKLNVRTNSKGTMVQDLIDTGFLYDSGSRSGGAVLWLWTDNPNGGS